MKIAAAACATLALAGCGGSAGLGPGDAKRLVELVRARAGGQVLTLAWSPSGERIAAGAPQGVIVFDARNGRVVRRFRTGSQVWGVAWRREGEALVAATDDGKVRRLPGGVVGGAHSGPAFSVSWSAEDDLAVGYADGSVRVLGAGTDRSSKSHTAEVIAVAWSHEGERLASGSIDSTIVVRDARSTSRFGEPEGADVNGLAWSPDDDRLAAANQDGVVRIWDVAGRNIVRRLRGHEGWTRGLAWSPSGRLIVSSGADGTFRIWDADKGREVRTLRAGRQEVWAVAWSPDGKRVASGDGDGSVRVWGLR